MYSAKDIAFATLKALGATAQGAVVVGKGLFGFAKEAKSIPVEVARTLLGPLYKYQQSQKRVQDAVDLQRMASAPTARVDVAPSSGGGGGAAKDLPGGGKDAGEEPSPKSSAAPEVTVVTPTTPAASKLTAATPAEATTAVPSKAPGSEKKKDASTPKPVAKPAEARGATTAPPAQPPPAAKKPEASPAEKKEGTRNKKKKDVEAEERAAELEFMKEMKAEADKNTPP
ncbi:expressed unknown protein [Ectocarpus siliculosus]|uniref:Uncharacterized protein n=1 Tax=Ectocarpus siliculosus TaxID=2880 RepID=D7G6H8_ECTSI|nr:expressed unknown protein [Ectocarpus siliculosus]|eukprot:CBJ27563.1 expressed unknown protein [Ectocarpus siliculosus]